MDGAWRDAGYSLSSDGPTTTITTTTIVIIFVFVRFIITGLVETFVKIVGGLLAVAWFMRLLLLNGVVAVGVPEPERVRAFALSSPVIVALTGDGVASTEESKRLTKAARARRSVSRTIRV